MDYGMIGKIEKARRYAEQRERIHIQSFRATLEGDHNRHVVEYSRGGWKCDCDFFATRGVCSHTMTMERVLEGMLHEAIEAE